MDLGTSSGGAPRIDGRTLLALRAYYFLTFGALGALFPYLPLLFDERGLGPSEIALVMVVGPASSLALPPIWGALADMLRSRMLLLRLATLGSALSVLLVYSAGGLGWSILAMVGYSLFRAPLGSLADATVFDAMGGKRADFSRVRVWGSVGFAFFAALMGLAGASTRPGLLVGVTSAIHLASVLVTLGLPSPSMRRQPGVVRGVLAVVGRPAVVLFLLGTAAYYAGHSTYDVYFGLHLRSLHLGDGFLGVAWAIGVTAEIGLMLAAPRFLHRVRSSVFLGIAASVAAARWVLLSSLVDPVAILATQPLHAVTFGLWYLSLAKHVQDRAPDHLRTSLQAVAISCMNLGTLAGYLGGGQLLASLGGGGLFGVAALAALAALALYAVVGVLTRGAGGADGSGRGRGSGSGDQSGTEGSSMRGGTRK